MKSFMVIVVAICFLWCPAYAADDCESEYSRLIQELEGSDIQASEKQKYLSGLKQALKLCREGKDEEADKIVKSLKDQGLSEEMFDNVGGN
jgi:hypothetical protein